jgi:branched-chain amino acid transport system permease protein
MAFRERGWVAVSDATITTSPAVWRRGLAGFLRGNRATLVLPVIGALMLFLLPQWSGDNQYWINQVGQIAILTLVVSGVNLSFGYAGEVQFGQVFMFALGAYVTAILAIHGLNDMLPLLLIAAAATFAAGAIVAMPALRLGGWALAIASFYLVIVIPDLTTILAKWTGGDVGLTGIPVPELFGSQLGTNALYELIIATTVVWVWAFRNLVTSRYGVIFRVLRESPVLAASLGFSEFRLKLTAYTLGSLPAGPAGCLFGFLLAFIAPNDFGLTLAIAVIAASVLGGVQSVYGAAVAAAILQLGPESSVSFQQYAPVAYGAFLIVAAVAFKAGLGGLGRNLAKRAATYIEGPSASAVGGGGVVSIGTADEAHEDTASLHSPRSAGRRLVISGVTKSFDGVTALSDVSLTAEPGTVTALLGSNGSGKTTLLNIVCGFLKPEAGTVALGDAPLTGLPASRVARSGIGRTFQTPTIPHGVSVLDVVASGRYQTDPCGVLSSIFRLPRFWQSRKADRAQAARLLELVGLSQLAEHEATSLSLGTRRLVEVARALAGEPGLLLLDEPASGLSSAEVRLLGEIIRAVAASGTTVVLVEHNFRFVTSFAQTAHVLHVGQRIASGPAATIGDDPAVIDSYLGSSVAVAASDGSSKTAHVHGGESV